MTQAPILVVDDNRDLARGLALIPSALPAAVEVAFSVDEAMARMRARPADLVVSDVRMPGGDGMHLLHRLREQWPATRVMLLTGFGTIQMAVDAIKAGAFHYLTKPFDNEELLVHARRALKEVADERELAALRMERGERQGFCGIVTRDRRMHELFETIRRVAPSSAAVMIRGESGTGKELVARAIHDTSDRAKRHFVAFNAAAVPETLAEGELFGARKGAYTGAQADRRGLFQLADGGTLFIDEVASMPLLLQGKLLRALQEHEIQPLGAERPIPVDVRIVSALNEDPAQLVREGRLRADLYYRLAVVTLHLPPLRDRLDDIALLATSFVQRFSPRGDTKELTPGALRRLLQHDWPGNVRELSNVIERAVLMARGREIDADDIHIEGASRPLPEPLAFESEPLPVAGEKDAVAGIIGAVDLSKSYDDAKKDVVDRFQRTYLEALLATHKGNISAAASAAGITRAALHRILKRWQEGGDEGEP